MLRKLIITILIFGTWAGAQAQDIHFAHIHASPIVLNPSLVGMYEGDIRVIGNYRQQWTSIPVNYRTIAASIESSLLDVGKKGFVTGGLQLLGDRAGDLNFTVSTANLSLAYATPLDYFGEHYVSFGIQGGIVNHSLDYSKIDAFDPEPLAGIAPNNFTYIDLAAGMSWFTSLDEDNLTYLGVSLYHLTRPDVRFARQIPTQGDRLYRRLVVHGGMERRLNDRINILPSFIFMDQGPNQEINLGAFFRMKANDPARKKDRSYFSLGAWVRGYWELASPQVRGIDAVILSARFDYKNTIYTFSYDLNVSSLRVVSNFRGGPEISVIFLADTPKKFRHKRRVRCPRF